jgi:hypothetical protein
VFWFFFLLSFEVVIPCVSLDPIRCYCAAVSLEREGHGTPANATA